MSWKQSWHGLERFGTWKCVMMGTQGLSFRFWAFQLHQQGNGHRDIFHGHSKADTHNITNTHHTHTHTLNCALLARSCRDCAKGGKFILWKILNASINSTLGNPIREQQTLGHSSIQTSFALPEKETPVSFIEHSPLCSPGSHQATPPARRALLVPLPVMCLKKLSIRWSMMIHQISLRSEQILLTLSCDWDQQWSPFMSKITYIPSKDLTLSRAQPGRRRCNYILFSSFLARMRRGLSLCG